jgi:hypothetical protein
MGRRGQITLFVIIGILLLFSVGLFLYLKNKTTIFQPEIVVPPELMPMKNYIEGCMRTLAEEGIVTLGQQSGYVRIPVDIERTPSSYVSVDPFNLVKMPYWYYRGEDRIPSLEYIRDEISRYINDNLLICIDNLSVFRDAYEIETGKLKVTTTLADKSVVVEAHYPLDVKSKQEIKRTKIKKFRVEIPVRLKSVYELASKIMKAENEHMFVENITIDIMAANPKIPFTGMEFECGIKKWHLKSIEDELQSVLYYNIPRIRIGNTDYEPFLKPRKEYEKFRKYTMEDINEGNYPEEEPPEDAYEYFHFLLNVKNLDKSLKAKLVYLPEWGMDIMAYPSDNGIMLSNQVEGMRQYLHFLCVNIYHFTYDVIYPVEVIVKDEESFNGEGYMFKFAFPVMIKNNQGNRLTTTVRQFESFEEDAEFCNEIGEEVATIYALGIFEGYTDMEIPDVNISYQCFNKFCRLGRTKADGGHYRLRTRLPAGCTNPIIIAEKDGYLRAKGQLVDNKVTLNMKKMKKMKYKVVKHVYQSVGGLLGKAEELKEGESVTISLQLKNSTFEQYKQYPVPQVADDTISLVEEGGSYTLDIVFTKDNDFVGGYKNDNLVISYNDLNAKDTITFHVFEYRPTPVTEKQKLPMVDYLLKKEYEEQLRPVFS